MPIGFDVIGLQVVQVVHNGQVATSCPTIWQRAGFEQLSIKVVVTACKKTHHRNVPKQPCLSLYYLPTGVYVLSKLSKQSSYMIVYELACSKYSGKVTLGPARGSPFGDSVRVPKVG